MGNIMFLSFGGKENTMFALSFVLYKWLSLYMHLILVTIFATVEFESPFVPSFSERSTLTLETKPGLGMLIYTWITSCIWPIVVYKLIEQANMFKDSTNRDLATYIRQELYADVQQLLKFGYMVPDDHYGDRFVEFPKKIYMCHYLIYVFYSGKASFTCSMPT